MRNYILGFTYIRLKTRQNEFVESDSRVVVNFMRGQVRTGGTLGKALGAGNVLNINFISRILRK